MTNLEGQVVPSSFAFTIDQAYHIDGIPRRWRQRRNHDRNFWMEVVRIANQPVRVQAQSLVSLL